MQPLAVVKHLDVVEELDLGLIQRGEALVMREFLFERAEEALHGRVVVRHAFAAHARSQAGCSELGQISAAGVLAALIAV